eukprot:1162114-Pelagomonas_calceolata.AAC.1
MAARTTYTNQKKGVGILDLNNDTRTIKGVINSILKNMQRTGESEWAAVRGTAVKHACMHV